MRTLPLRAWFASSGSLGFSLIELAIAMGIVSFVLISLLGLMTVSMGASKRSYEDTTVANLAQIVVSELKTNDYSVASAMNADRFFRYDGSPFTNTPTPSDPSYYQCHIQAQAHTSIALPASARNTNAGFRLRLDFMWSGKTNETFETTIARY